MKELLHVLNLDTVGGVEIQFRNYLATTAAHEGCRHHVLASAGRIHPLIETTVSGRAASVAYAKFAGPWKLPRRPGLLRARHLRRQLAAHSGRTCVLWNQIGTPGVVEEAQRAGCRVVYYEHGAAWLTPRPDAARELLERVDAVVSLSRAGQRMLAHRWPSARAADVIHYGLRREGAAPSARRRARERLVLGMAGRLLPIKGMSLVLHALALLEQRGVACELHIAGCGPLESALRSLAGRLGLANVRFLGLVEDMDVFFDGLDLFLCPSLREPFGLVCLEAASRGCPVLATAVDGLAESVREGVSGLLVEPDLSVERYVDFGGTLEGLPPLVYHPRSDSVGPPRVASPGVWAAAIERLASDPELRGRLRTGALELVAREHDIELYARELNELFIGQGHAPRETAARQKPLGDRYGV